MPKTKYNRETYIVKKEYGTIGCLNRKYREKCPIHFEIKVYIILRPLVHTLRFYFFLCVCMVYLY